MNQKPKYPLTTQTQKICVVIRKPEPIKVELLESWLRENCEKWAYVTHKNHIDPVTHGVIPVHYHFVAKIKKQKSPLSVTLNSLVKFLRLDNADGVQIDKYDSEIKMLQYLIHRNNPEKTPLSIEEVVHNYDKDEFQLLMTCDNEQPFTFDLCYSLCERYDNVVDLLRNIPPRMFKDNYKYIATIWNFLHYGKNEL